MYDSKPWQTWFLACWLLRGLLGSRWHWLAHWSLCLSSAASTLDIDNFCCYFSLWLVHFLLRLRLHIESAWETSWAKCSFPLKLLLANLGRTQHSLARDRSLYNLRILHWFEALNNSHITGFNLLVLSMHYMRDHWRSLWLLPLTKGRLCLRLGQSLVLDLGLLWLVLLFVWPIMDCLLANCWTFWLFR